MMAGPDPIGSRPGLDQTHPVERIEVLAHRGARELDIVGELERGGVCRSRLRRSTMRRFHLGSAERVLTPTSS